jgi:hypothetical protein
LANILDAVIEENGTTLQLSYNPRTGQWATEKVKVSPSR